MAYFEPRGRGREGWSFVGHLDSLGIGLEGESGATG